MVSYFRIIILIILPMLGLELNNNSASANDEKECYPEYPRAIVYDLINSKEQKVGTASLVDSKRAIFITARHLLKEKGLKLAKPSLNKTYDFNVIFRGQATVALMDDWAILKAQTPSSKNGLWLLPDAELIYDEVSGVELAASSILISEDEVLRNESIEWSKVSAGERFGLCKNIPVSLLNISSKYDKGHSGSPVFSKDRCGIVALTSRFVIPSEINNETQKTIVEYFYKYSNLKNDEEFKNKPNDLEKILIIREYLKDKTYVKAVPISCIINNIVDKTWSDKSKNSEIYKLIREDTRPDTNMLINAISNPKNISFTGYIDYVSNHLKKHDWRWLEFLQLLDSLHRAEFQPGYNEKRLEYELLDSPITELALSKHFSKAILAFFPVTERYKDGLKSDTAGKDNYDALNEMKTFNLIGEEFKVRNASIATSAKWSFIYPWNQLHLPTTTDVPYDSEALVAAGQELMKALHSDQHKALPEEIKRDVANSATGLFALGLAQLQKAELPIVPSNEIVTIYPFTPPELAPFLATTSMSLLPEQAKEYGRILTQLSSAVEYTQPNTISEISLAKNLATSGRSLIADENDAYWKLAKSTEEVLELELELELAKLKQFQLNTDQWTGSGKDIYGLGYGNAIASKTISPYLDGTTILIPDADGSFRIERRF